VIQAEGYPSIQELGLFHKLEKSLKMMSHKDEYKPYPFR
jgi:hypothetical protein